MHVEAHAGLGWALGVVTPGGDRRLRNWCVVAAVLPDVDAVSFLFGPEAYARFHHTFGHNVFLGLVVSALALAHLKSARASVVALAFASHLLADMKLSAYPVHLFWPFGEAGYELAPNLGLAAPINTWLVYGSFALAALLAAVRGVSPLDVISTRLDRIVLNRFRARPDACATCGRRCNDRCDACARPTCLRHGRIDRRFRIACPACAVAAPTGANP